MSSDSTQAPAVALARSPNPRRAERVIAAGRAVLATASLVAIWLDPGAPVVYERLTYLLLACYLAYSVLLLPFAWSRRLFVPHLPLATHVADLAAFSVFMYTTEGPTSPFFLFFVFALLAGTLRWDWRGAVATGTAALTVFLGLGVYASRVLGDPTFELDRFVIRGAYLAVLTGLIAYLGRYERATRDSLAQLAAWPPAVAEQRAALVERALDHAARVLGTDRLATLFEQGDEPFRYFHLRQGREVRGERLPPDAFEPPVDPSLAGTDFLCHDVTAANPLVWTARDAAPRRHHGPPIHPDLIDRLGAESLLCLRLRGDAATGWLLVGDRPGLTVDDIPLGAVVARTLCSLLDQHHLIDRLRDSAAAEERLRIARDLHDGVLQALAATGLQLEQVRRTLATDPADARTQVEALQDGVVAEQRELRRLIAELRPAPTRPAPRRLGAELQAVCDRAALQWGLRVDLRCEGSAENVPEPLVGETARLLQEALANAGRHAGATSVEVSAAISGDRLELTVQDDGHGLGFDDRLDHAALLARGRGPGTLLERAAALGGSVAVRSSVAGATVEIELPLAQGGD